jgi:hypothetical protein
MKILFLYYTHYPDRPLTGNINLIWGASVRKPEHKLPAYNKAIPFFMQTEVIEQRNTFEYMGK